jgi:hypothetical protein
MPLSSSWNPEEIVNKLKLDVDALQVETFGTVNGPPAWSGTVAAAGAAGEGPGRVPNDTTAMPDCDVSGVQSCVYTNCGNHTCETCEPQTWCGHSCKLVCDAQATVAVG